MRFEKFIKAFGPVMALALAGGLAGCDKAGFRVNGEEGVPLAELDLSGDPPTEIVLMGSDKVQLKTGKALAITVDGDAAVTEGLRFVLSGGSLAIMREPESWDRSGSATINVTMPAPRKVVVAGSGSVFAAALAEDAEVDIAGSGRFEASKIKAKSLKVNIAGSGSFRGSGTAARLDLNIVGSGSADLAGLKVERADVTVAGSGDTVFASDGEVKAKIMGSGDVTVRGSARCRVNSFGSGTLTCERGTEAAD